MLRYLASLGIRPGVNVTLLDRAPFDEQRSGQQRTNVRRNNADAARKRDRDPLPAPEQGGQAVLQGAVLTYVARPRLEPFQRALTGLAMAAFGRYCYIYF